MMLVLFFNYDQVDQFQRLVKEWLDSLPRPHSANLRTTVQNELDRVLHQMDLALNVGSFLSLLDKESGALRNQVPLHEMVLDHNDPSKPSHHLTNDPEPSKTIESDGSNIKKPS